MRLNFSISVLLIFIVQLSYGQTNCDRKYGVECYGSGIDSYSKIDAPPSFYRGTRGITIGVTYQGFTASAQTAFDYSKQIWESILNGTVAIKVNAYFLPIGAGGSLAITFPNGRKNFPGAIVNDVWYPTSLANQLAGAELNVGESDFDIFLNSSVNWYFGTDGNCPVGKYDFVSVALHEMCHGLGLVGLSKIDTGGVGSIGTLTIDDFSPAITSFPWPELDTLPGIFDHFLMTSNGALLSQGAFQNPSDTLAALFTNNQIYWSGIFGLQFNNNIEPNIYAPSVFALGSSMVHLDEATYPNGNPNELMTPLATSHSSNHNPGPIALAILKDIGWNVDPTFNSVDELQIADSDFQIYPNPVSSQLTVYSPQDAVHPQSEGCCALADCLITISDILGRTITTIHEPPSTNYSIDVSNFTNGIYFIEMKTEKGNRVLKFVKQ